MEVLEIGPKDKTGRAIVCLHGFPGIRSRQNREIAERVASETRRQTYVLLYRGLGQAPGVFSFEECIRDVRQFFLDLISKGVMTIDLVGHSWGGFLSLLMTSENPRAIGKIVLMSPLLKFYAEDICRPSFAETARANPQVALLNADLLSQEFVHVSEKYPSESLIRSVPEATEILFLQAKNDLITPEGEALRMLKHFRRQPQFFLVDQDHSFLSNRQDLARQIATFLLS